MLRLLLAVLASLPLAAGAATTHTWPTDADCNGSLQACINNTAAAGDTVRIASNGPIDETLGIGIPLTLVAAPGYRPVFSAGHAISGFYGPGAGVNWSMTIQGLTLLGGDVGIRSYSGNATITLRDLVVTVTGSTYIGGGLGIDYFPNTAIPGSLQFTMANNVVTMAAAGSIGLYATAGNSTATITMTGTVRDNRVVVVPGINAGGMFFSANGNPSTLRIFSNQANNGITVFPKAAMTADIVSNAVHCNPDSTGIALDLFTSGGTTSINAFNNTLADCDTGVYVGSGFTSVRLTNNLIAFNTNGVSFNSGIEAVISADHNLLFGNGYTQPLFNPGPGSLSSDPKLRRAPLPGNVRLDAASPAIEAGNTTELNALLTADSLASLDADGSRRIKGAGNAVDIGAFEYGDVTFLHRVNNADPGLDRISHIDNPALNGDGTRYAQVTANWNPDLESGIYDNQPIGLTFDNVSVLGDWYLNTENLANFPNGARFNVFAPAKGNGNYKHVVTAANISGFATQLDNPSLNDHSDRIVLATRDSADPNGTIYDDTHPFSVFYFAFGGPGSWFVSHNDSTSMNAGGTYHVYWQEPSLTAFTHTALAPNISSDYTVLSHPLLDGRPCARFHITQSEAGGVFNPHFVGVFYSTFYGKWAIYNQDLANMQANAAFNVVIDEAQAYECANDKIFADGFGS
jgi:hypothetical protein